MRMVCQLWAMNGRDLCLPSPPTDPPPAKSIAAVNLLTLPEKEGAARAVGGGTSGTTAAGIATPLKTQITPSATPALSLGEGLAPIPGKIVQRIQAQEFVDFSELLPDNQTLLRRLEATDNAHSDATSAKKLRQVTSISTWAQCFMLYAAVLLQKHPERASDLMVYGKMILREAARNPGDGWKVYDTLFRQQAEGNKEMSWTKLNSTLYATTFMAMRAQSGGAQCRYCMESDHLDSECALAPASIQREQSSTWVQPPSPRPFKPPGRKGRQFTRICRSFNFSTCAGPPECEYRHVCLRCRKAPHRVAECPEPPEESEPAPPAKQSRREADRPPRT